MFQKPINLQELFLRLNNLLRTKDVLRDYYMAAGSVGITTPGLNNTDERFILSVTDYIHAHLDDPGLSSTNWRVLRISAARNSISASSG